MRSRAHSFHLASRFLPAKIRQDVQIVYSYYRLVDDLVDETPIGYSQNDVLRQLNRWKEAIEDGHSEHPQIAGLFGIIDRYNIPPAYLTMVLDGTSLDVNREWVATRADLLDYSVLVAGSVGMVMAHILGASNALALDFACDLGVAMQLTNILRDVGEDLRRGRLYLPREDLLNAGFSSPTFPRPPSIDDLMRETLAVRSVMADLSSEARRHYSHGVAGIDYLEPSCRFSILLAASLYSRILEKIEARNFDVLGKRVYLGELEKWKDAVQLYFSRRLEPLTA